MGRNMVKAMSGPTFDSVVIANGPVMPGSAAGQVPGAVAVAGAPPLAAGAPPLAGGAGIPALTAGMPTLVTGAVPLCAGAERPAVPSGGAVTPACVTFDPE